MVLDKLGDSLKHTLSKIKNSLTVDRTLVEEVVKEIQKSLLSSDVNVRLVLELSKKIRDRAVSENSKGLNKKEHLITIIYEELSSFLGQGEEFTLKEDKQNRLLLVGLYGQGKTTTAAKLGHYFKKRSQKVALLSTDTWRPAAGEQLQQLGKQAEIDVYTDPQEKDPVAIYEKFKNQLEKYSLVIIDSAGRDFLNDELVEEISKLNEIAQPTDTFLVLGADVGQTAQKQAQMFKERLDINGVIITKMDGTGKGGGALSACAVVEAPVRFIGVGEKIDEFERFNSERFVSELLGMGDLEALLEKAKLALDENKAQDMQERFMSGKFDLNDMYEQLKAMKKMGSMSKLISMIPGLGGMNIDKSQLSVQEQKLKVWGHVMDSMTPYEKKYPEEIDFSRTRRIASGSGTDASDVRELLKQFKQMKKMMHMFKNPSDMEDMDMENMKNPQDMMKMMKQMGMKQKDLKKMMKGARR